MRSDFIPYYGSIIYATTMFIQAWTSRSRSSFALVCLSIICTGGTLWLPGLVEHYTLGKCIWSMYLIHSVYSVYRDRGQMMTRQFYGYTPVVVGGHCVLIWVYGWYQSVSVVYLPGWYVLVSIVMPSSWHTAHSACRFMFRVYENTHTLPAMRSLVRLRGLRHMTSIDTQLLVRSLDVETPSFWSVVQSICSSRWPVLLPYLVTPLSLTCVRVTATGGNLLGRAFADMLLGPGCRSFIQTINDRQFVALIGPYRATYLFETGTVSFTVTVTKGQSLPCFLVPDRIAAQDRTLQQHYYLWSQAEHLATQGFVDTVVLASRLHLPAGHKVRLFLERLAADAVHSVAYLLHGRLTEDAVAQTGFYGHRHAYAQTSRPCSGWRNSYVDYSQDKTVGAGWQAAALARIHPWWIHGQIMARYDMLVTTLIASENWYDDVLYTSDGWRMFCQYIHTRFGLRFPQMSACATLPTVADVLVEVLMNAVHHGCSHMQMAYRTTHTSSDAIHLAVSQSNCFDTIEHMRGLLCDSTCDAMIRGLHDISAYIKQCPVQYRYIARWGHPASISFFVDK
jgi:hypothetical protein